MQGFRSYALKSMIPHGMPFSPNAFSISLQICIDVLSLLFSILEAEMHTAFTGFSSDFIITSLMRCFFIVSFCCFFHQRLRKTQQLSVRVLQQYFLFYVTHPVTLVLTGKNILKQRHPLRFHFLHKSFYVLYINLKIYAVSKRIS